METTRKTGVALHKHPIIIPFTNQPHCFSAFDGGGREDGKS